MANSSAPTTDLQLVPARRLARLVSDRLHVADRPLADILAAPQSLEIDPALLPDAELRWIAERLENSGTIVLTPRWSEPLHLDGRRLWVSGRRTRLPRRAGIEDVTKRYVRLVHQLRGRPSDGRLVLRHHELVALGHLTGIPFPLLHRQARTDLELLRWIGGSPIRQLRTKVGVPAISVMAGMIAMGGLELLRRELLGTSGASMSGAGPTPDATSSVDVVRPPLSVLEPRQLTWGWFGDGLPNRAGVTIRFDGAQDDVAAAALELIPFDWQARLPGWTIVFGDQVPQRLGYAYFDERRIEIYVRGDQTPREVAEVLAHELGHALDVTVLDGDQRRRWLAARGLDGLDWWPPEGARSDFASGAGDWAEAFAMWLLDDISQSGVGGPLTAKQLALVGELVRGDDLSPGR